MHQGDMSPGMPHLLQNPSTSSRSIFVLFSSDEASDRTVFGRVDLESRQARPEVQPPLPQVFLLRSLSF
jgi:hypothetical protein